MAPEGPPLRARTPPRPQNPSDCTLPWPTEGPTRAPEPPGAPLYIFRASRPRVRGFRTTNSQQSPENLEKRPNLPLLPHPLALHEPRHTLVHSSETCRLSGARLPLSSFLNDLIPSAERRLSPRKHPPWTASTATGWSFNHCCRAI